MRILHVLLVAGLILVFIPLASCADGAKEAQLVSDATMNMDSISALIENGRDPGIEREQRALMLQKALALANSVHDESEKAGHFSRLSLAYLRLPDSSMFRKTNKTAIMLAQKVMDTVAQAEAHWDLASLFQGIAVVDSAFYHYSRAHELYSELGNDLMTARMLYNLAVIQAEAKDYTGGEINIIRAIELLKPLDSYIHLYLCYNNLGSITKELEEYERAIYYYAEAQKYQAKIEEPNTYQLSLANNIGIVYQEMGQHPTAIPYFKTVISHPGLKKSNPRLYARALSNLAFSRQKQDNSLDMTDTYTEVIHIQDSIQDIHGIARGHYNVAQYYKDTKDTSHAIAHAGLAREYALKSKNNKRLLETMELLVSLDPDNAVAHTQAYIKLDDSLQKEERAIRNKFARIRFETDEFIAQNELLARQRQLWIGVAAGVFMLAFSVLIIIIQRIRNQRLKFQQQQQEANQEIFNLMLTQNQKLEEGKQSEQKRISEELHDGILGEMNGVRMVLLGLNKKADEAAVALRSQAIAKLQEIQEEIRTISHALSDASYRKFHNFVISLEELLRNTGDAAGIAHEMTYDEDIDWDALKGDVKINLYRIVQESLQNCVKHAEASTISLDLHGNSTYLEITISDDGKGFSSQNGKKGIGQKNINSRVKKIGGSWKITSSQGKGTTVKVKVPIGKEIKNEGGGRPRTSKLQEV